MTAWVQASSIVMIGWIAGVIAICALFVWVVRKVRRYLVKKKQPEIRQIVY